MNELQTVAFMVAAKSADLIPELIEKPNLPSVSDRLGAVQALEAVVAQNSLPTSRRVWATVFAVITAVLAVPDVQALMGSWAPVATAVLSAMLAAWSKASDPRPTR